MRAWPRLAERTAPCFGTNRATGRSMRCTARRGRRLRRPRPAWRRDSADLFDRKPPPQARAVRRPRRQDELGVQGRTRATRKGGSSAVDAVDLECRAEFRQRCEQRDRGVPATDDRIDTGGRRCGGISCSEPSRASGLEHGVLRARRRNRSRTARWVQRDDLGEMIGWKSFSARCAGAFFKSRRRARK